MKAWHFGTAWLLLLCACSVEPGGTSGFGSDAADTTGTSTTTVGGETGDTTDTSSTSGSTVAGDSTGDASSAGTSSSATTSETSGTAGASCGDGIPDGDEECDDGNDDEFDGCTSECTVPVCDDGLHNGDETDVDCGGTCQGCALCQTCLDESDCESATICGADSQCVTLAEMNIDWTANCGSAAQGATIEALAAGTYRATAIQSAGTLWLPPHNPPTTGYFFEAECTGVSFEEMRTPAGVRYINANTAFSNMVSQTETFDYAGGNLTCWIVDATCGDNDGSVEFSLESVCAR
ncbi:MAG: DUF4215 domain-containing protein [Nannocystaceae bacterium]|nr:DUF4215 domain-containing protein [Nannocystaceae bacterium]